MKKPTCASKQDGLVLATIRYEKRTNIFWTISNKNVHCEQYVKFIRDNELGR